VLWGNTLGKLIRSDGPLPRGDIQALERDLALALPPA